MTLGEPSWDPAAGVLVVPVGGRVAWVVRSAGSEIIVEILDARVRKSGSMKVPAAFGAIGIAVRPTGGVVPRVQLAFRWPSGLRPDLAVQEGPGVLLLKPGIRRGGEAELESLPQSVTGERPVLRTPEPRVTASPTALPLAAVSLPASQPPEAPATRERPRSLLLLHVEQVETLDSRTAGLQAGYPVGLSQAWIEHWWGNWLGTGLSWRQLGWTSRGPAGLLQRQEDRIQAGVGGRWAPASWVDVQGWGWVAARQSVVVPEPPRSGVDPSLGLVVQLLPLSPVTLRLHLQGYAPGPDGTLPWRGGGDFLFDAGPTMWSFGYDHDEGPSPGGQQTVLGSLRLGVGWSW